MNYSLHDPNAYIRKYGDQKIVFQQPFQQRLLGNFLSSIFVTVMLVLIYKSYLAMSNGDFWLVLPAFVIMFGPLTILIIWLNAPYLLSLDLNHHTYTLTQGYKPFERVSSGPFNDIDSLQVRSKYSSRAGRRTYLMVLVWKRHNISLKSSFVVIGNTYKKQEAETLLSQYANSLNVQFINNF